MIFGTRDVQDEFDLFECVSAVDGHTIWQVTYPATGQLDYGSSPRYAADSPRASLPSGCFGRPALCRSPVGAIVWRKNYRTDFGADGKLTWGDCGSPLIADGKLIVVPGGPQASVVALDPADGDVVWRTPGAAPAYGSLLAGTFGGVPQVVGHDASSLGGWELASGRRLWRSSRPPLTISMFRRPSPRTGRLVVTSENNGTRLYEFSSDGSLIPRPVSVNEDWAPDITTPVLVGTKLYGIWNDLFCLDLDDNLKTVWTQSDSSYRTHGSLIASDDRLLVVGASGELLLLDTRSPTCQIVSRLQVFDDGDAELYAHPAIVGSRLYFRGHDSLVCVELAP